jgi:hypothetical protein
LHAPLICHPRTAAFFSIVLLVGDVYEVRWPSEYLDFLDFFFLLEFDLVQLFKFDCLYSYNSDLALFYFSAFLLVLELSVLIGLTFQHRNGETGSGMLGRVIGILLLLTYLIYPFGCKVLFSTFNCINVDGVRYLRADMGIDCASPGHHTAQKLWRVS